MVAATSLAFERADAGQRLRYLAVLAGLALWLLYTRLFWTLRASHAVPPPCPFYLITGHPCPFCGGTRSFAYMWEGDVLQAVRLYPFGPLLFTGTLAAVVGLAAGVVSGRSFEIRIPDAVQKRLLAIGGLLLAASWALKLFWLGN